MARTDPKSNDTTESARDATGQRSIYSLKSLSVSIVVAGIAGTVVLLSSEWLPF